MEARARGRRPRRVGRAVLRDTALGSRDRGKREMIEARTPLAESRNLPGAVGGRILFSCSVRRSPPLEPNSPRSRPFIPSRSPTRNALRPNACWTWTERPTSAGLPARDLILASRPSKAALQPRCAPARSRERHRRRRCAREDDPQHDGRQVARTGRPRGLDAAGGSLLGAPRPRSESLALVRVQRCRAAPRCFDARSARSNRVGLPGVHVDG